MTDETEKSLFVIYRFLYLSLSSLSLLLSLSLLSHSHSLSSSEIKRHRVLNFEQVNVCTNENECNFRQHFSN